VPKTSSGPSTWTFVCTTPLTKMERGTLLTNLDIERLWRAASVTEQRTLVEDLVDSVFIYSDQITVQVAGAPPFIIGLDEVGLTQGCKPNGVGEPTCTISAWRIDLWA
jgi:hypothetical protein